MAKRLKYKYHFNNLLPENSSEYIFVFGSNLAGIHKTDLGEIAQTYYYAETGISIGLTGNSYAIPIKDRFIRILHINDVKKYVDQFIEFTNNQPDKKFWISDFCIDKKGYKPNQFAILFRGCNNNCNFPLSWKPYLK